MKHTHNKCDEAQRSVMKRKSAESTAGDNVLASHTQH